MTAAAGSGAPRIARTAATAAAPHRSRSRVFERDAADGDEREVADAGQAAELAEEVGAAMVEGLGLGGTGVEDGADAEVVRALPREEEGALG